MRITYIVTYDIADAKRLRRAFNACTNFGNHLQYSVFECDLSPKERTEMETELKGIIKHDEDQVLFVSLGLSSNDATLVIEALGQPYLVRTRVTII